MPRFLWTQKQDIGPKPRVGHAMAYDSSRERLVLFGGDSLRVALFNDTWEWDGENWTQMADIGPSPRSGHAMAFDMSRQRVVLYGGSAGAAPRSDTWEWDGEDWTQVADSGPEARDSHAMTFDSSRNRVILFGGETLTNGILGDTWEWDGDVWTQAEDTGPSARKASALAYDSERKRVVLFGGDSGNGGLGDTWEWDGTTWTQMAGFGPDPALNATMVFKGDRIALFGGLSTSNAAGDPRVFGNTWEWNGKHWTQRQDIGPGPRWRHAMAFDSKRGRIVLFGGLSAFGDAEPADHILGDTWEHTERGTAVPPPVAPPPVTPQITLQSFIITPPTVEISASANGTITLSGINAGTSFVVILKAAPDVVQFISPQIKTGEIPELGPGIHTVLEFPAGTQSLPFQIKPRPELIGPGLPTTVITITATLGESSKTASLTIT